VIAGAAVIAPAILWKSLKGRALKDIPVTLLGPSAIAGHRFRNGFQFPEPSEFKNTQVLIVGGGMSGLSAGYRFLKRGLKDFKVLELENEVGGNSRSGKNDMSRYPRGAHYITLLNEDAVYAKEIYEDL
jgi:NADPH-dependent 2,4-dienoyl-CoA reductase/sulfur reductase-like enzyme